MRGVNESTPLIGQPVRALYSRRHFCFLRCLACASVGNSCLLYLHCTSKPQRGLWLQLFVLKLSFRRGAACILARELRLRSPLPGVTRADLSRESSGALAVLVLVLRGTLGVLVRHVVRYVWNTGLRLSALYCVRNHICVAYWCVCVCSFAVVGSDCGRASCCSSVVG